MVYSASEFEPKTRKKIFLIRFLTANSPTLSLRGGDSFIIRLCPKWPSTNWGLNLLPSVSRETNLPTFA